MKSKKASVLTKLLSIVISVFILTGCNKHTSVSNNTNSENKTLVLKMGHHLSDTDGNNKMAIKFAELVEQKSKGRIKIEIYTNGQLGGQRECLESLKTGSLDMSISDTGLLANYAPAIGVLDLPYMFDSRQQARKVLNSEVGDSIKDIVAEKSGIRPLTLEGVLFRDTLLNGKEIMKPEDLQGLKIRTPENPAITMTFQSFGATPVAIPSGEAYSAIQTKIVDGLEGNAEFITLSKYYEVAKTWIKTEHVLTNTAMNISEKLWQSLSESDKEIFRESASEALDYFYPLYDEILANSIKTLENNGIKFFDVDKELFKAKVKPAVEKYIKDNGLEDLYKKIEQAKAR